jgi:hypothetical protein
MVIAIQMSFSHSKHLSIDFYFCFSRYLQQCFNRPLRILEGLQDFSLINWIAKQIKITSTLDSYES